MHLIARSPELTPKNPAAAKIVETMSFRGSGNQQLTEKNQSELRIIVTQKLRVARNPSETLWIRKKRCPASQEKNQVAPSCAKPMPSQRGRYPESRLQSRSVRIQIQTMWSRSDRHFGKTEPNPLLRNLAWKVKHLVVRNFEGTEMRRDEGNPTPKANFQTWRYPILTEWMRVGTLIEPTRKTLAARNPILKKKLLVELLIEQTAMRPRRCSPAQTARTQIQIASNPRLPRKPQHARRI
jgi:hypothetical protein